MMSSAEEIFEVESTDESDNDNERQVDEPKYRPIRDSRKRLDIQDRHHLLQLLHQHESPENREGLYPKSLWQERFAHKLHECENKILDHLPKSSGKGRRKVYREGSEFTEINLSKFSVYHSIRSVQYPGMLEGLHIVASECKSTGKLAFYLDGSIARPNGGSSFISGMKIVDVSIGGLETECHGVRDSIWVQTQAGLEHDDCWYKLVSPAPEYLTHWKDFLWIANFSKHCIDFLTSLPGQVGLTHFANDFWGYVNGLHQHDLEFKEWSIACGRIHDFRRHVIRHRLFLRDQAANVDARLLKHPVWDEIGVGRLSLDQEMNSPSESTVLTPRIAEGFLRTFPHWAKNGLDLIQVMKSEGIIEQQREARRLALNFPNKYVAFKDENLEDFPRSASKIQRLHQTAARRSHLVATASLHDMIEQVIVVRSKSELHFGLVVAVTKNHKSVRVVWLAMPCETICADRKRQAHYPIEDELFFTDRCNCRTVQQSSILAVHSVALFTESAGACDMFVRSRFMSRENAIVDAGPGEWMDGHCQDMQCPRSIYSRHPHRIPIRSTDDIMKAPALQNLSLFSGAGLFDRALEISGSISTVLSVEHSEAAVLSIRANTSADAKHDSVIGSVDQELDAFLTGKHTYRQFDMCSAGCPCQGFSQLNNLRHEKTNLRSQKNVSLLASTLSYIDLFLPRYVVIENVVAMDTSSPACAQAVCQLVALGYQVRKFCLRASEHGGCTTRERLFIVAAAPRHKIPEVPSPTHSSDTGSMLKTITTAQEAIGNIPSIRNDTNVNIMFPDHIPLERYKLLLRELESVSIRDLVQRIPLEPPSQGLYESYRFLSPLQKQWYTSFAKRNREKLKKGSKMLSRIRADKPIPAVVTRVNYSDARHGGNILHYNQHRCLSLEEIKIAQGLPDWFLLVSNIAEQHKQIGNGVPWALGSAIGRVIGNSWQTTWEKQQPGYNDQESIQTSADIRKPKDASDSDPDSDTIVVCSRTGRARKFVNKNEHIETAVKPIEVIEVSSGDEYEARRQSVDSSYDENEAPASDEDVETEDEPRADESIPNQGFDVDVDMDADADGDYNAESDSDSNSDSDSDKSVIFLSERKL